VRLCVVIPVYNEARWVDEAVARVLAVAPDPARTRAIILINDGSTDGTRERVDALAGRFPADIVACHHDQNRGKGAALATGLARAREVGCDAALVHDADLEYDPRDHAAALAPIADGRADAVIGSRFLGQTHRVLYYWHSVANRVITTLSNMTSNLNLTDIECCTKAFAAPVLERLRIAEPRFGVEPELVARLARMRLPDPSGPGAVRRLRIYEVPVSYAGRTYAEGKKIRWTDGVAAIACIGRYGVLGAGDGPGESGRG
jgi:glycosyltransferase involved in cell wall biosynthesis